MPIPLIPLPPIDLPLLDQRPLIARQIQTQIDPFAPPEQQLLRHLPSEDLLRSRVDSRLDGPQHVVNLIEDDGDGGVVLMVFGREGEELSEDEDELGESTKGGDEEGAELLFTLQSGDGREGESRKLMVGTLLAAERGGKRKS
jgi:hypothetical protein